MSDTKAVTLDGVSLRDADDALRSFKDKFSIPDDIVYLDGNSLGALPKRTARRINDLVQEEWGKDLISSWNKHGWFHLPLIVGSKIAKLIGAYGIEVTVCDSTSINLFKVLAAALKLRPDRKTILSEASNFPTDLYMIQGLISLLGNGHVLKLVDLSEIESSMDESVAVVVLTHVNYRTGRMADMQRVTESAHGCGALIIWDLAHSAGAVKLDLTANNVDFAVGCGYKYLNGGPGAPSFVYVNEKLHTAMEQPLSGWFGHANPFAFEPEFRPIGSIRSMECGTPPILSVVGLEVGVDLALEADMDQVREKSVGLTSLFIDLVEQECGSHGFQLVSPRDSSQRGSQVCLRHPSGYAIVQAMIARGVIGDFRAPDILRFGFSPLYVGYSDVWNAVKHLKQIMELREWDQSQFHKRATVT